MKNYFVYIIPLILLSASFGYTQSDKEKIELISNSYFPVNNGMKLVYESSFGETITKYYQDNEFTVSLSEGDDFKYKQTLMIKDDGIYVKETYQFFKIFLFINKEETFTYGKALLRSY